VSRSSAVSIFCLALLGTMILQQANPGHIPWAVSRAAGLAAFAILSLSVILGLLISTKAADGLLSRPFVFDMHQFLSVVSLTLIGVHAGSLIFDGFLHLSPVAVVVPLMSPYRTVAVGVGVIAAWLTAISAGSFWVRSRIGVKRWRKLHYLTFLAYIAGLGHGVFAGTDSSTPVVMWGYLASAAAVMALLTLRIAGSPAKRPAAPPAKGARPALKGRRADSRA